MNRKLNEDIDKRIRVCLNNEVKDISVPENMLFKVRSELLNEKKGVFNKMKYKFLKPRIAIVAGILCIATTITCFAVTNSFSRTSSTIKDSTTVEFPTADKVKSTVGFLPKYIDKFAGGFKFDRFAAANSALTNDKGDTVVNAKEVHFFYKKDGASKDKILSMSATSIDKGYFDNEIASNNDKYIKDNIIDYKGIRVYYESVRFKLVPTNYVMTKEEEKLVKQGALQISYGADSVSETMNQGVIWYDNGIEYCIVNTAYEDIGKDAMIQMAKDVIEK